MVLEDLGTALAERLGAREVTGLVRLSGGASRETFRFDADGRPLVLQRQRAGDLRDMGVEAAVLRAAHAGGVPVPAVVDASRARSPIGGAFMVLERIEGETIARKVLRDDTYERGRSMLAEQFGRALARIHAVDTTDLAGLTDTDQLEQYRAVLATSGAPHPTFELAIRWLDAHRPASTRRTLVHGDFRLGNVIVGPDGLRAVLDWELAHLGDPMEDLGWLCVKAWRFGATLPVAGVGEMDDLLRGYRDESGIAIDARVVHWWQVLGTLKWGIMCIMQASSHLTGTVRSHELAAIGRRVCENEHDLFLALEGCW